MVMIQVNIHEAKAKLSHLLEMAMKGERVIVCKHNVPYVELTPVQAPKRERQVGWAKGLITISEDCFDPMSEEELKEIEEGHPQDPMREFLVKDGEATS